MDCINTSSDQHLRLPFYSGSLDWMNSNFSTFTTDSLGLNFDNCNVFMVGCRDYFTF